MSFRCGQCHTHARASSLWWTNLAPIAFHFGVYPVCDTSVRSSSLWWTNFVPIACHFGVANLIQMLDPALCGGPTLHTLSFSSVSPVLYNCSIQFFVVEQPCTHCISSRCGQCDTDGRSNSLWWGQPCTHCMSCRCSPFVIQVLDPAFCGGSTSHQLHFISV